MKPVSNGYSFSTTKGGSNVFCPWRWQGRRQLGLPNTPGESNQVTAGLYSAIKPLHTWESSGSSLNTHQGGIFNFDFSPDGSVLAAACEGKGILLFDPFNGKLCGYKEKAHLDCVNCVKFLDTRVLATCSDDSTIALWDTRYLKYKLQNLNGHSSWVKNVEYASNKDLLVSSGFDGSIFTWDINSYSEDGAKGKKVFNYKPLMRSKLSPDGTKLFVSTDNGHILLIHNLDLSTLAEDLVIFSPYQFRQLIENHAGAGSNKKRNQVEVINDWPMGNKASVIASLQVHPQGWCVLSRNTSRDRSSEWTCIHDVQDGKEDSEDSSAKDPSDTRKNCGSTSPPLSPVRPWSPRVRQSNHPALVHHQRRGVLDYESDQSGEEVPVRTRLRITNSRARSTVNISRTGVTAHISSPNLSNSRLISNIQHDTESPGSPLSDTDSDVGDTVVIRMDHQEDRDEPQQEDGEISDPDQDENSRLSDSPHTDSPDELEARRAISDILTIVFGSGPRRQVFQFNHSEGVSDISEDESPLQFPCEKRLLYYADEPNVGRGFIKELCFSSTGRMVCSPFGFGVRLLTFDSQCSELCEVVPKAPVKLYELGSCMSHTNNVLTCKFSPTHPLLVTGCLSGRVVFHQPVL
ncbi:DDB1- and CUL4-associated factor 10-like [Mizuhopecten yessoensis]|uniref:DDB1-and CUL4-associated factor 10-like n=1 Tax=Mizuhopecten yessoensis TaxID=6573 RepID=A0A210PJ32_MIZYE|nr:DDB1- and CUL4-associated factor 10-like [Mizuhopecten yessoensis]OWF36502.1 DDB1- and CUL4-associated factor 10-like [Mizuhopecten yessoensis]